MGVVAVAVEGTVLHARLGGVPRVLLTGVLPWLRFVPRLRVAPMLAEGSALNAVALSNILISI